MYGLRVIISLVLRDLRCPSPEDYDRRYRLELQENAQELIEKCLV